MLALGLILNAAGVGLFCWLIFTLAVYALPFFVALGAGLAALHSGAGLVGALLAGFAAAALTFAFAQFAFVIAPSHFACCGGCDFCRSGRNSWLLRCSRNVVVWCTVAALARDLRLSWCDRCCPDDMDADQRVHRTTPNRTGQGGREPASTNLHWRSRQASSFASPSIAIPLQRFGRAFRAGLAKPFLSEHCRIIARLVRRACMVSWRLVLTCLVEQTAFSCTVFLFLRWKLPTSCITQPISATSSP